MISIIGGLKKRTKISVPQKSVRPTTSQKRESIFSILESYEKKINHNIYKQSNVLDLFAGSGSLGLEAMSRGANFGYFYEKNIEVIGYLKKNCLKICKEKNFEIIQNDILNDNFIDLKRKISLVFIDPPYKINFIKKILINLYKSKTLSKNAIIILETSKKSCVEIPSFYSIFDNRIYGKTKIYFLIKNN